MSVLYCVYHFNGPHGSITRIYTLGYRDWKQNLYFSLRYRDVLAFSLLSNLLCPTLFLKSKRLKISFVSPFYLFYLMSLSLIHWVCVFVAVNSLFLSYFTKLLTYLVSHHSSIVFKMHFRMRKLHVNFSFSRKSFDWFWNVYSYSS